MALHSLKGTALVGCGVGSSCDSVLGGRWSTLLGIIPVSAPAAGVYLCLMACCAVLLFLSDDSLKMLSEQVLILLSGCIIGSAIWFVGLQVFEEHSLCKYCMSAHVIGLIISALLLTVCLPAVRRGGWILSLGLFLAACLAVFQVLTVPDYVYQDGSTEEPLPLVSAQGSPVIGDPDAEYVIDLLFDYQCSHCQRLHPLLEDVVDSFDGRVALVLCPCPLSPKCNPYVPMEDNRFEGSCDLARLALALYSIDEDAYWSFDRWLFESGSDTQWRPRNVADAVLMAEGLVGAEALDAALKDTAIDDRLRRTADLFGRTSADGKGGIPRFIRSREWVVPETDAVEDLVKILSTSFDIPVGEK